MDEWFKKKSSGLNFPFYSSFDIRDSGIMVAPVDANIFPAGFNNICQVDQENAVELVKGYLKLHYGSEIKKIALLAEEHTNNLFYWNNVETLYSLLMQSACDVKIAVPRTLASPLSLTNAAGKPLQIFGAEVIDDYLVVDNTKMDLIICNNDFSNSYQDWIKNLKTPMNPPHTLGWHQRRKSSFFELYNQLAFEFAQVIDLFPPLIQVETELFSGLDLADDASREKLALTVGAFLSRLEQKYQGLNIDQPPFAFIKNNSGTYGMGVTQVRSADEVRNWNYKVRKKMKAAKGGRQIEEVIIQEGIPTRIISESETAEPTIYMIGCHLAGGFLRAHSQKGPDESLNSPGAVFKRLCVSDLKISIEGAPLENVYGWLARLGFLAIAHEAQKAQVQFVGYHPGCSL